ncbi:Uncharacterized protein FWK35_00001319 [Aphis craccivora]|uniref:Reverse transcriptase domain-containing protein n=1 Tax=Aphis craccivora TaxID=307492 RepID=A0A6G0ZJI3_APHCR|nr:Uncharacterized protein FWK35_00001319 [Aphis craccivora]
MILIRQKPFFVIVEPCMPIRKDVHRSRSLYRGNPVSVCTRISAHPPRRATRPRAPVFDPGLRASGRKCCPPDDAPSISGDTGPDPANPDPLSPLGAEIEIPETSILATQSNNEEKSPTPLGARGPAPGDTMQDSSSYMEVDQTAQTLAPKNAKKQKVADNRQDSLGPTEAPNSNNWSAKLREKLNKARSTMRTVASDTRKLIERTPDAELRSYLENLLSRTSDAYTAVDSLLEKNGDVLDLPRFATTGKSTSDASTDMELTPAHWDSLAPRTTAAIRQKRLPKLTAPQRPLDTEADTGMDTEAEEWSKVVGRRPKKVVTTTAAASHPPAAQLQQPSGFSRKAPAILIKNAEGKTYRDTVLAVRNCGLSREEIGANVTMRQTRDGSLLLELPKGASSTTAAKNIMSAMSARLGESVGRVQQLGLLVEVEVLDMEADDRCVARRVRIRRKPPGLGRLRRQKTINLNVNWGAEQLMAQTVDELGADVLIVSEPATHYGQEDRWCFSSDRKAAVGISRHSTLSHVHRGSGNGFAWMAFRDFTIFSCYFRPGATMQEFNTAMGDLEDAIRARGDTLSSWPGTSMHEEGSRPLGGSEQDPQGSRQHTEPSGVGDYERLPSRSYFPAALVLIKKGADKPSDAPSSYKPICILDVTGKLLERLLLQRLEKHLDEHNGRRRAPNQYGFRQGISIETAVNCVLNLAAQAAATPRKKSLYVLVTLDVKNAFNSLRWPMIDKALRHVQTPEYLVDMLRSWLSDRTLLAGAERTSRPVTCGVPQGSVLGPALWNVAYDSLMRMDVLPGVKLIGFADDLAVVGTAVTGQLLEDLVNPVLLSIDDWMSRHGLELAHQSPDHTLREDQIPRGDPGQELDVDTVAKKASRTAAALARLMPNIGGVEEKVAWHRREQPAAIIRRTRLDRGEPPYIIQYMFTFCFSKISS